MAIDTYAVLVQKTDDLQETEIQAWLGLLHTHARLTRELDAELEAAHGISLSSYEVLWRVNAAGDGRMRMTELAETVLLSPSGLSRLVDRLCQEQLIERVACPGDGRAINATITDLGRTRLAAAEQTNIDGIRRRFLGHFSAGEIEQMAEFWTRVAPHCDS